MKTTQGYTIDEARGVLAAAVGFDEGLNAYVSLDVLDEGELLMKLVDRRDAFGTEGDKRSSYRITITPVD